MGRVAEVQYELKDAITKCEAIEKNSKDQDFELTTLTSMIQEAWVEMQGYQKELRVWHSLAGTNIPRLEQINDFLNEFDDMPPEQEDDNKGEEGNMEEEYSMEEEDSIEGEEQEIKYLKRKRVFEGDSKPEDLFCEAEEEEEEGFVEPTHVEKLPIRRGPTTRSHCSSEDIFEEEYVPLSDDGTDGEVDSDDEVVLYYSSSGRKSRSKKKKGRIWFDENMLVP
ncbi:hypothetical protein D1007_00521 [Hordeum vulgare]|nr:hypothetical protein D1007_00521 [Hordeum vulgare]